MSVESVSKSPKSDVSHVESVAFAFADRFLKQCVSEISNPHQPSQILDGIRILSIGDKKTRLNDVTCSTFNTRPKD